MNEGRQCKVVLLNGQRLDIIVQSKLKTSDLIEITLSHFFVKEQQCFGLYTFDNNYVSWLDPKKNVLDHEFIKRDGPLTIYLGVKYYLVSTCMIGDLKAIELFYLQARSHISQGFLACDAAVMSSLASLALQFEHKDFVDDVHFTSVLGKSQVLPSSHSSTDHESEIKRKYKDLIRMSRGEALVKYLKLVESQSMYGVHFYSVKDKRGNSYWLGISLKGIIVVDTDSRRPSAQTSRPTLFQWFQLENIFHSDKKFHFEETKINAGDGSTSTSSQPRQNTLTHPFSTTSVIVHCFNAETPSMAKCIWSACVDQHHFYLESTKMKPVRNRVESLAKELDESLSARKQGHHMETFHTERFKQMTEVFHLLKNKRSMLDSMLKDKNNLVKMLQDEENALMSKTSLIGQQKEICSTNQDQLEKKSIKSYDHYETNKTLEALDEIFKVDQLITVGYYKLVLLHNNTTSKLVQKMVTLQMTTGGDFKRKYLDQKRKWVEMYKKSLDKLKEIEKKVNTYRRVLDKSSVDYASRFEDHKITQRPISSVQKNMVCSQRQHCHENRQNETGFGSSRSADDSLKTSRSSVVSNLPCSNPLNSQNLTRGFPIFQLPPIPPINKAVPSPSVVSATGSMSSSSSSSSCASRHHHQHQYQTTDTSSSSTLSSPYTLESKQLSNSGGSLPRPPKNDPEMFTYPERGHRSVVKNHSCDNLGGRTVKNLLIERDLFPMSTSKVKVIRPNEGYDTRSIKALSKRHSYKMALESDNVDVNGDDADDDDDDNDNLYNVSSKRISHVLVRSSSTHHTFDCHHQQPNNSADQHVHRGDHGNQHHHHHHQQHHSCHQRLLLQCPTSSHNHNLMNIHHQQKHQNAQYMQQIQQQRQKQHDCTMASGAAMEAGDTSQGQIREESHSRKSSESSKVKERSQSLKPPLHRSEKQGLPHHRTNEPRNHIYQYVPVDKSPSVTSTRIKSSKSSLPASTVSIINNVSSEVQNITPNFVSCFKPQKKTSEPFSKEEEPLKPNAPQTPEYVGGGRKPFYESPPDLRRNFIEADEIDLSTLYDKRKDEKILWVAATSANLSFVRTLESSDLDDSVVSTSLFFDASDWIHENMCDLGGQGQHLQPQDFEHCMEHFKKLHNHSKSDAHHRKLHDKSFLHRQPNQQMGHISLTPFPVRRFERQQQELDRQQQELDRQQLTTNRQGRPRTTSCSATGGRSDRSENHHPSQK